MAPTKRSRTHSRTSARGPRSPNRTKTPPASGSGTSAERLSRRLLVGGGLALLPGIALVALGPSDLGIALCLAGLLGVIGGIHTYGRLGAPAPT